MEEKRIQFSLDPNAENAAPAATVKQPQAEQKIVYASIAERFIALLIDYGVIFIPLQLLSTFLVKHFQPEWDWNQLLLMLLSFHIVFILYEAVFSCGDRVSLGKGLVGIAVMKKDGSGPISFPRALLRSIGYYISAVLFMCGFFLAFIDNQRRSLHDRLGGSIVVQLRPKSTSERLVLRLVGSVLLLLFGWTTYQQTIGGQALADKTKVRQAQNHLRKIAMLEEEHGVRYGYYTSDLLRLALLSGDPVQFQRDTKKVLDQRGLTIGTTEKSYKIKAVAKDKDHTPVVFEP